MPCKPIALCSALLLHKGKKKKKKETQRKQTDAALELVVEPKRISVASPAGIPKEQDRISEASPMRTSDKDMRRRIPEGSKGISEIPKRTSGKEGFSIRRSSSQAHREFLRSTARGSEGGKISSPLALPSLETAFSHFLSAYPRFVETRALDELRAREYYHLENEEEEEEEEEGEGGGGEEELGPGQDQRQGQGNELVCLDYCGFGLFSHAQREGMIEEEEGTTSNFSLSEVPANLWSHALFGSAHEGTMEWSIRTRIMEFLNIPESEYSLVFTASRGSSFKLLSDAYPWNERTRLVTMYDYESESVGWMEHRAAERGSRVFRARFRWPSLRVCSSELKRELLIGSGKRKHSNPQTSSLLGIGSWLEKVSSHHLKQDQSKEKKGLFVFPVQSRVSGSKYSYQWMSLAQQNQWHVMLDASALGPKDMDSLGLSLFRPDFITASFYKLFGGDPSGFGCLLIKNSVAQSIQDPSGAQVSGMVRITPLPPHQGFVTSSTSGDSEALDVPKMMVSAFSGPVPSFEDNDGPSFHHMPRCIENPALCEDNYSSACEDPDVVSIDGIGRSPIFSEDGNDNPFFHGTSSSPAGFAEEPLSGPLQQEPKGQIASLNSHIIQGRKDARIRIKDLCSGLLHLHTGRVGNSGDNIEEEEQEDGRKDKDLNLLKHLIEPHPDKLTLTDVSKLQSIRFELGSKEEKVRERLMLVLKKYKEEQLALGNDEWSLQLQDQDEEKLGLRDLETIEEIEMEIDQSMLYSQQDSMVSDGAKLSKFESNSSSKDRARILSSQKDSAICRETEGGFRLLGRRDSDRFSLSKILSTGCPSNESSHSRSIFPGTHEDLSFGRSSRTGEGEEQVDDEEKNRIQEPELICRCLDHADMMGLNKTSFRLRFLINWLISSLLRLKHPGKDLSLVRIYGPQVRYDRGASVAFNLFDQNGKLLNPDLIRMLADDINISLGLGFLRNIYLRGNLIKTPVAGFVDLDAIDATTKPDNVPSRVEVLTASLGLLSDFKDVHKLWAFVARFLDPDYVTRELNHLNLSSSSDLVVEEDENGQDVI